MMKSVRKRRIPLEENLKTTYAGYVTMRTVIVPNETEKEHIMKVGLMNLKTGVSKLDEKRNILSVKMMNMIDMNELFLDKKVVFYTF